MPDDERPYWEHDFDARCRERARVAKEGGRWKYDCYTCGAALNPVSYDCDQCRRRAREHDKRKEAAP